MQIVGFPVLRLLYVDKVLKMVTSHYRITAAEMHSFDNESGRFSVLQGLQVQFSVFPNMHQDKTCNITNYNDKII